MAPGMDDGYRHKGLRLRLVEEIRGKGITDPNVLEAIGRVPRHLFMESGFLKFSYKDSAFPIGAGQTISQPYTVAFQTQLLGVKPLDQVLEIGTGSGYQTAVLVEMGARVYSIERQRELFIKAQATLQGLGYHAHLFFGDGLKGMPSYGPYRGILVTAGASQVPPALVEQLEVGGRLVIPVGDRAAQSMLLVERISETEVRTSTHGRFIFVPLLQGINQ